MKIIKNIVFISSFFLFFLGITILSVRKPSYTIQTKGNLYIVNKLSSSITVFDLGQGKEIIELPIDIGPHEATTSFNQNRVIVTNYGTPNNEGKSITIINTKINKIEKTLSLNESLKPHGIITFPQSNKVGVVTDKGNDLLVVNLETGIVEKKISTKQQFSHLLALHPKKPEVYITNMSSNSVSVIDLELNQVIKIILCGLGTEGIDVTPDGEEIWVTNNKENSIQIISTDNYQVIDTIQVGQEPSRLKFSVDGKHCLVSNTKEGTISVYSRDYKKLIKTISLPGKKNIIERILYHTPRPVGILTHPNGLYAFVSNSNADKIEVIDMKTLSIVSSIGTGRVPDGMAFVK